MVKALSWRIGLSIALFLLLLIAFSYGLRSNITSQYDATMQQKYSLPTTLAMVYYNLVLCGSYPLGFWPPFRVAKNKRTFARPPLLRRRISLPFPYNPLRQHPHSRPPTSLSPVFICGVPTQSLLRNWLWYTHHVVSLLHYD